MKRFIVFLFYNYYPDGGLNDVADSFDTLDEAIKCLRESPENQHGHVFDCDERRAVIDKMEIQYENNS